jgi:hypothetical protein
MEQFKRAGSPLAHKRVSKAPKEWSSGGPQQQTAVKRLGSNPSARAVAGVQRNAAELQAANAVESAAAQVARDSRGSLRRFAALAALIAIGLSPGGGWGTPLSGGLAGPVAGPVAGPFAMHLASGGAGGLPAVVKACRKQAAAKPFLEMAATGRSGRWAASRSSGAGPSPKRGWVWQGDGLSGPMAPSWSPWGLGKISQTEVAMHFVAG